MAFWNRPPKISEAQQKYESALSNMHNEMQIRIAEAVNSFTDTFVNCNDELYDPTTGDTWHICGVNNKSQQTQTSLNNMRGASRALARINEWAINIITNRINYVIGNGHVYTVSPIDKDSDSAAFAAESINKELVKFFDLNQWPLRQQNTRERIDRDGEAFIRLFNYDGKTYIRFIEPEYIFTPQDKQSQKNIKLGIQHAPDDIETIEGYWVNSEFVPASEVQHRKLGVDFGEIRGVPLLFSVGKNLHRAEKLLQNMSVVAQIQSSIAMIRKHAGGNSTTVGNFRNNNADASYTNSITGNTMYGKRYSPGTILDVPASTEYDFTAGSINAAEYVGILQAELRATAAAVILPEHMISSDASNANYSSTMVAESPAVKNFESIQFKTISEDLELINKVLEFSIRDKESQLSQEDLDLVRIDISPPSLNVRDMFKDIMGDVKLKDAGAMSVQTLAAKYGLDHKQELANIEELKQSIPEVDPVDPEEDKEDLE